MATKYHVNPRYRAYGKARIDIAQRAASRADWDRLWKAPQHPFPFRWGRRWKQNIEYKVDDFAAEVGFYIDVLGLPVIAFDANYAMFTSPEEDFTFTVVPAYAGEASTPPDAIRIQFMVDDILTTTEELQQRGIQFEQMPEPIAAASALFISTFNSPHGICVDLWGLVEESEEQEADRPDASAAAVEGPLEEEIEPQEHPVLNQLPWAASETEREIPLSRKDEPRFEPPRQGEDEGSEQEVENETNAPVAADQDEFELTYEDIAEEDEAEEKAESPWKTNLLDSLDKFRGGRIRPKVVQRRLGN